MHLEKLNAIFNEVGRRDGIPDLRLAPDGTGGMELKSGIRVFFEYREKDGRLCVYTPLAPVPQDEKKRLRFFGAILDSNFFGTDSGSMAVVRHLGQASYQVRLDARSLNANQLDETIDIVLERRESALRHLDAAMQLAESGQAEASTTAHSARFRFAALNRTAGVRPHR